MVNSNLLSQQQGEYIRKSVSAIPLWIKPNALLQEIKVPIDPKNPFKKKVIGTKKIDFNINFFNKLAKTYIEIDRFDYNQVPEIFLKNFQTELDKINDSNVSDYEKVLPEIIEKTVLIEILKLLNDPDIQAYRGKRLKNQSDYQSFAATKAKSMGLTIEQLKIFMNSAYVYLPYITKIKVDEKLDNLIIDGGIIWYQILVSSDGKASLKRVSVNNATGQSVFGNNYDPINKTYLFNVDNEMINPGPDKQFCTSDDFATDDSGLEYGFYTHIVGPGIEEGRATTELGCIQLWGIKIKDSELNLFSALHAFAKNLGAYTKEIDAFRLQAQINQVHGGTFSFSLGSNEGINLDDEFYIVEVIEDENGFEVNNKVGYARVTSVNNSTASLMKKYGREYYSKKGQDNTENFSKAVKLWGPRLSDGYIVMENSSINWYNDFQIVLVRNLNIMKDNTYFYTDDIFDFLSNSDAGDWENYSAAYLYENWDQIMQEQGGDKDSFMAQPLPVHSEDITSGLGFLWTTKENLAPQTGVSQLYTSARLGLIIPEIKPSDYMDYHFHFIVPFDVLVMSRYYGRRLSFGFSGGLGLDFYYSFGDVKKKNVWFEEDISGKHSLLLIELPITLGFHSKFMLTPDTHLVFSSYYRYNIDPLAWAGLDTFDGKSLLFSEERENFPDFINYSENNLGGIYINIGLSYLKKTDKWAIGQRESSFVY